MQTREQHETAMVTAHKQGLALAHKHADEAVIDRLERDFATQDERDAFRAGFVMEKRRMRKS